MEIENLRIKIVETTEIMHQGSTEIQKSIYTYIWKIKYAVVLSVLKLHWKNEQIYKSKMY